MEEKGFDPRGKDLKKIGMKGAEVITNHSEIDDIYEGRNVTAEKATIVHSETLS